MIDMISRYFISFFKNNGAIEEDENEKDICKYGCEITLSSILNVVIVTF